MVFDITSYFVCWYSMDVFWRVIPRYYISLGPTVWIIAISLSMVQRYLSCVSNNADGKLSFAFRHEKLSTLFGVSYRIIIDKTIPCDIVKINAINVACKWQVAFVCMGRMSVENWQTKWLKCTVSDAWILPHHESKCVAPCFNTRYESSFSKITYHIFLLNVIIYFFSVAEITLMSLSL